MSFTLDWLSIESLSENDLPFNDKNNDLHKVIKLRLH